LPDGGAGEPNAASWEAVGVNGASTHETLDGDELEPD
jgi:hypothetical protein